MTPAWQEVIDRIEARREPALRDHTQDDLVQVHYSEILVLEETIEDLLSALAEQQRLAKPTLL